MTSGGRTLYSASYDADGNMTSRNGYAITWTVDNLPASLASAQGSSTFSYGPDGNRYAQAATFNGVTTDTTYIGGLFEVISSSSSTEYRHNILADGQIIAVHTIDQNGSASTAYLHSDQLGSVDAITDDSGNVIQSMSFDAFGQRRDAANWDYDLSQNQIATLKDYTDRGYTDQEQLDNLSLVDLNGRVYDPTVGRVISADPSIPDPGYSQAFDRYTYVYNSPLIYSDPSGFAADACPTQQSNSGDDNQKKDSSAADGTDSSSSDCQNQNASSNGNADNTAQLGTISVTAWVILSTTNFACAGDCLLALALWDGGQQSFFLSNSTDNGGQGNSKADQNSTQPKAPANANSPATPNPPSTTQPCPAGVPPSSRSNNPSLNLNMKIGAMTGGTLAAGVSVFVVINIIGFPEAELAEGGAGLLAALAWGGTVATGAGVGAMYGIPVGGALGYAVTPPTPTPCD